MPSERVVAKVVLQKLSPILPALSDTFLITDSFFSPPGTAQNQNGGKDNAGLEKGDEGKK